MIAWLVLLDVELRGSVEMFKSGQEVRLDVTQNGYKTVFANLPKDFIFVLKSVRSSPVDPGSQRLMTMRARPLPKYSAGMRWRAS